MHTQTRKSDSPLSIYHFLLSQAHSLFTTYHFPLQNHHHLLHHLVSRGAELNVLLMHVHVFHHFLFRKMGKAGTIGGADIIDPAHVGAQVQELAGRAFVQPVTVPVAPQPLFFECGHRHVEMSSNAADIFESIGGRHFAAAIGATQAIHFPPDIFLHFFGQFVQSTRRAFFQSGQEFLKGCFPMMHPLPEGTEINNCFTAHASKIRIQRLRFTGKRIFAGEIDHWLFLF